MWKPGRADNNCDTNTDEVAAFLSEKGVDTSMYLYMATDWANMDRHRLTKVLRKLELSKYKVCGGIFGGRAVRCGGRGEWYSLST